MSRGEQMRKIGVIGAGPCGLPVCKALDALGLDYECLEAGDRVGGVWNVEGAGTGAYRSLHTNTATTSMAYSDYPFAPGPPEHLSAARLQAYFEAYAKNFGLHSKIRFGHRVAQATPLDDGGWRVETEDGLTREYSAIVVATGQYVRPRWPEPAFPGEFDGDQIHVFDYLDPVTPVDCRGKSVVVVGLGSSAAEIASELSDPEGDHGPASEVHMAARSGRWVLNKIIDGKPIDAAVPHPSTPPPGFLRALPERVGLWLMRQILRTVFRRLVEKSGSPESLGLPVPEIEPWAERPTLSLDFVPALRAGRIEVHPGIAAFEGKTVRFTDGTCLDADVILYATGYQLDFPFLAPDVLDCEAPDLALYQQIVHPSRENLFFVGCLRVTCSMWPVAEQQGRWIAKLLSGGFRLPDSSARERLAVPLAKSMPVMCSFYVEKLRRQAGGF